MRDLKELFTVLKESEEIFIDSQARGLCNLCSTLRDRRVITYDEYCRVVDYIESHRPKWYSKHYSVSSKGSGYYWPRYHWKPRLKWINAQIRKLK